MVPRENESVTTAEDVKPIIRVLKLALKGVGKLVPTGPTTLSHQQLHVTGLLATVLANFRGAADLLKPPLTTPAATVARSLTFGAVSLAYLDQHRDEIEELVAGQEWKSLHNERKVLRAAKKLPAEVDLAETRLRSLDDEIADLHVVK